MGGQGGIGNSAMTENHTPAAKQHAELRESWDINAAAWVNAVRGGAIGSRKLGTDAAIVEAIRALAPARLLDVGCGEGWLARTLAQYGVRVTGIDGSAQLIVEANSLGGGDFHHVTYEQLERDPDIVPGPFDCAVFNFALLSEDVRGLLTAVRDRLQPFGHIVIQTVHPLTARDDAPYADGWRREDFQSFGGEFRAAMPWYYRTFGSWIGELYAAGFTLVDCSEPLHPETNLPLSLLLTAGSHSKKRPA